MSDTKKDTPKWTEIEHLPEWDEELYQVYTAKKYGKWLMLKTLRPELRDKPEYQAMIEQEFEVRYNLAHPNIIMINDFEEVPGVGLSIITDDVYGLSLRKIIDSGKVTQHHIDQITNQLVSAMYYIQVNHLVHHPIRPETVIFTENIENLKLIDVGFEHRKNLSPIDVSDDIYAFGMLLKETLDKSGLQNPRLNRIAARCLDPNPKHRYRNVESLRMAISGRSNTYIYLAAIAFLAIMVAILILLIIKK